MRARLTQGAVIRFRPKNAAQSRTKTPAGLPAGVLEFFPSINRSRSWIEVVLDAQDAGPNMGVPDRHVGYPCGARRDIELHRSAFERRLGHGGVEHVHADIEVPHRVPQRSGTDLPRLPIGAAGI